MAAADYGDIPASASTQRDRRLEASPNVCSGVINTPLIDLVALLRGMEKFPFARKSALRSTQAGIEEVRADVNADFLEEPSVV